MSEQYKLRSDIKISPLQTLVEYNDAIEQEYVLKGYEVNGLWLDEDVFESIFERVS